MGLFNKLRQWAARSVRLNRRQWRVCRFEQMEPRQLLAADPLLHLGAVYVEDNNGDDNSPDRIEITFNGGAPGTQLTELVIDTDKDGNGLSIGDCLFDTQAGGLGAYAAQPLVLVSHQGIDSVTWDVADGGTKLVFHFSGFEAGEKLVFSIDVDEMGYSEPNSLAEGNEFEGSKLAGTFTAPHYAVANGSDIFVDYYDAKLVGTGLNLPPDSYVPPGTTPRNDHTAGAVAPILQIPLPSSIAGTVYEDFDGDNYRDPVDTPLAGVSVSLYELINGDYVFTGRSTTTDAAGNYRFDALRPGTYRVVETQPAGYASVGATAGTVDGATRGAVTNVDVISSVSLLGGEDSIHNDFAEYRPASVSGRVIADLNLNCTYDAGTDKLLSGVTVELTDAQGTVLSTTTTDTLGEYRFDNLRPGVYRIHEVQPAGYFDSGDHVGTVGGALDPTDAIRGITLVSASNGLHYDFCEIQPVNLCGYVYEDNNNNGIKEAGEAGIAGVTVYLTGAGLTAPLAAITNENGRYCFIGLTPGTYAVNEVQPTAYYDGLDTPGSRGGVANNPGDSIDTIPLVGGNGTDYNFGELKPASISGHVHAELDRDCIRDENEPWLAGVTIWLLDGSGNRIRSTTTNANGEYSFTNLAPGTYGVEEIQPADYLDGTDHVGSVGGAILANDKLGQVVLGAGVNGINYDFCELTPASISGHVYVDNNDNGLRDASESWLSGVTVWLLDSNGNRIQSTTTNASGAYSFTMLTPGVYGVEEIQPAGYLDASDHVGSAGGVILANDKLGQAQLDPGVNGINYDFGELLPASLSGYVFKDGETITYRSDQAQPDAYAIRDGQLTPDDTRLAGVTIMLCDATGLPLTDAKGHPLTTTTDANGYYEFELLRPGTYTIREVQPDGYTDFIDSAGSLGGTAVNRNKAVDAGVISTLAIDPKYDAILRVELSPGEVGQNYNFSEVVLATVPPPVVPPVTPTPPGSPIYLPPTDMPLRPQGPLPMPGVGVGYPIFTPTPGPAMFGGTGGAEICAWHLSVINGGQPRRDDANLPYFSETTTQIFDPRSWTGANLHQNEWVVANAQGQVLTTFVFGMPGAQPVPADFNGDGKADAGVFYGGHWFLDLSGDFVWDDGDLWAKLGNGNDQPVVGDWDGDGKADIGIFGASWLGDARALTAEPGLPDAQNPNTRRMKNVPPAPEDATNGYRTMKRTAQGKLRADLIDHVFQFGVTGDKPVVGDWNGDGVKTIGIFRDGRWFLDMDGDGRWSPGDVYAEFGEAGDLAVVGDWTGDGTTKLGVYRHGRFILDTNGNRQIDESDASFTVDGPEGKPAAADFDGDGKTDVAVMREKAA